MVNLQKSKKSKKLGFRKTRKNNNKNKTNAHLVKIFLDVPKLEVIVVKNIYSCLKI